MPAYVSALRVYEPLAAFPEEERRHWTSYVSLGAAPDRPRAVALEHRESLIGLLAIPPRVAPPEDWEDRALVMVVDGMTYVSPMTARQRAWEGLARFRESVPPELADAFVPPASVAVAEQEEAAWRAAHPEARVFQQTSTWQVPLPWFVVVEPTERRVVLGPRAVGEPGGSDRLTAPLTRSLIYTTEMSRARRRIARALAVLRRTVAEGSIVDGLEDLGRWLEEFHPHARVELDYGGLVHLLSDDDLLEDDSCGDVAAALARLAEGDGPGAFEHYRRLATRWRQVGALESAN